MEKGKLGSPLTDKCIPVGIFDVSIFHDIVLPCLYDFKRSYLCHGHWFSLWLRVAAAATATDSSSHVAPILSHFHHSKNLLVLVVAHLVFTKMLWWAFSVSLKRFYKVWGKYGSFKPYKSSAKCVPGLCVLTSTVSNMVRVCSTHCFTKELSLRGGSSLQMRIKLSVLLCWCSFT